MRRLRTIHRVAMETGAGTFAHCTVTARRRREQRESDFVRCRGDCPGGRRPRWDRTRASARLGRVRVQGLSQPLQPWAGRSATEAVKLHQGPMSAVPIDRWSLSDQASPAHVRQTRLSIGCNVRPGRRPMEAIMQQSGAKAERTTRVVHRGYVIHARGWRESADGWVARAEVKLRGRQVLLESDNKRTRSWRTKEQAIRAVLERAQYLIDCRELPTVTAVSKE